MNANNRQRAAFTLTELMAVVLVILLLVGASLGVVRFVTEKAKVHQTKAQIAALEAAIESFKSDNGFYPTSTIFRLSYQPYRVQTNSWLLYQQLTAGPKKYITFRADQVAYESASGATFIKDAWGSPIVYYNPGSNVPYQAFAVTDDTNLFYAVNRYYWTQGGQVNTMSFDLLSYGPDKMTYIGVNDPTNTWNNSSLANDDITNFK